MCVSLKLATSRVTSLALFLTAVFAAALTPVTKKVASRPKSRLPLLSMPLAVCIFAVLVWSSGRLFAVNAVFAFGLAVVSAILATQVVIDLYVRRLLRELSYAGLAAFTACSLFVDSQKASGFRGLVLGAVLMTAIAAILVVASRGALGMGDLHLSPLLGALLGWFSPGAILLAWIVTAFAGALFTSVGLVTKRLSRGSLIPYGPFMVFGTVASVALIATRA